MVVREIVQKLMFFAGILYISQEDESALAFFLWYRLIKEWVILASEKEEVYFSNITLS